MSVSSTLGGGYPADPHALCHFCGIRMVDSAVAGYDECPRCHATARSPRAQRVQSAKAVSYCPSCGMPGVGPCVSCGYDPMAPMPASIPYLGLPGAFGSFGSLGAALATGAGDPTDTSGATPPLNRRDSVAEAFTADLRKALDTVLGPEPATGMGGDKLPAPTRALDGMQATLADLFTAIDAAHLEDYPRDAATLDAGGEIVARIAAWGITLMAALYARSELANDARENGEEPEA